VIARRLLGPLVAIGIFFGCGELLARTLHVVDRLNGYAGLLFAPGPDGDLPYLLRPGVHTRFVNADVRVNALGLRGPDIAPEPPPGVRRILILGDSVAFGQGLAEEETVSARLAAALHHAGDARYEVVNAGVPGYDTTAEAGLLARLRPVLHPDVVVVVFSLNDYDPAPLYSPIGTLIQRDLGDRTARWYDHSAFIVLGRWLLGWTHGSLLYQIARREHAPDEPGGRIAALEQAVERLHLDFYREPVPKYWDRMRHAFLALRRAAAGCRLLVVIAPEAFQIEKPDPDLTPQRRVLALCRETGVDCLDVHPRFAAAGGALFLDTLHPNARGHEVMAGVIAAALRAGAGATS